jgi:hypothetical protein
LATSGFGGYRLAPEQSAETRSSHSDQAPELPMAETSVPADGIDQDPFKNPGGPD